MNSERICQFSKRYNTISENKVNICNILLIQENSLGICISNLLHIERWVNRTEQNRRNEKKREKKRRKAQYVLAVKAGFALHVQNIIQGPLKDFSRSQMTIVKDQFGLGFFS